MCVELVAHGVAVNQDRCVLNFAQAVPFQPRLQQGGYEALASQGCCKGYLQIEHVRQYVLRSESAERMPGISVLLGGKGLQHPLEWPGLAING